MSVLERYLAQVLLVINGALIVGLLAMSMVAYGLLEHAKPVPFLVQVKPHTEQVAQVLPLQGKTQARSLLFEQLARQYVRLRETLEPTTQGDRFSQVRLFSSDEVWHTFWSWMQPKDPKSPAVQFEREGLTRSVHIISSHLSGDHVRVVWRSIDRHGPEERGAAVWETVLHFQCVDELLQGEARFINPLGWKVVSWHTQGAS